MTAIFSPCKRYRYRLDRRIDFLNNSTIGFCLHNPSTADDEADDATSRRGIGFAKAFGASRIVFVNPWAGIATRPRDLWAMDDPVGPDNDNYIAETAIEIASLSGLMIVGWGVVSPPARYRLIAAERLRTVITVIIGTGCRVGALGVNLDGSPKHILYLPSNTRPTEWPLPA